MKRPAIDSGLLLLRETTSERKIRMQSLWRRELLPAIVIIYVILMAHDSLAQNAEIIRAKVRQGVMRGTTMTSEKGRTFYAFQGIPYSKPPTGQLRFRAPEPLASWEGELDASKPGSSCMQIGDFLSAVGSEDCLYLNVFTPHLPQQNGSLNTQNGGLLDVMFGIHGGLFFSGSGSDYPPQYLMDQEVVFVSVNYRLGVFGFMSTGDEESPGNYGMRDQLAALNWVKENIAALGGNPNSVTIFGQSSGSSCVHYHMLSPLSKGLFHRAISMAGTAISPWARCPNPLGLAQRQAQLVNCSTSNTSVLVDCLRDTDAATLARSLDFTFVPFLICDMIYTPCPEHQSPRNPEPFLPADPLYLIRTGNFSKVPWIVGANSQDVSSFLGPFLNFDVTRELVNQHAEYLLRKLLFLTTSLPNAQIDSVFKKVTQFYLSGNIVFSQENWYQVTEMLTDRNFIHPAKNSVELHTSAGHNEIFWYNFAYRGLYSNTISTSLRNYGVAHGDELQYFFPTSPIDWIKGSNDREVMELMLSLWTNLAEFGNPTPPNIPKDSSDSSLVNNISWLPVGDIAHLRCFNIGQVVLNSPAEFLNENLGPVKLNVAVDLYKERMTFWDSLPLNEN